MSEQDYARHVLALPPEDPECLEAGDDCAGPVEYRWPGYGERNWPRCEYHGEQRVMREGYAIARYGNPDSPCAPAGFDPLDAGERWDED